MRHGHNAYAGHGDAIGASESRIDRLTEIKAPTLVVHGTEDPILPLDNGMTLAEYIPGAKKFVMDGVGHEMPEIIEEKLGLFPTAQQQTVR